MSDESSGSAEPRTHAELCARIDQSWDALGKLIDGLSEQQLTQVRDTNGWSVKDHLAHLIAWEQSLLALLEGRDRNAAVGLTPEQVEGKSIDEENDLIYQSYRDRPLDAIRAESRQSHEQVVAAIEQLGDAGLHKPYSHYQPDSTPDNQQPVVGWIVGNTYEHYEEHAGWIRQMFSK